MFEKPKVFKSLNEVWSFLYQLVDKLNYTGNDLIIGNTVLTEEELKELKKLIGGNRNG